jgi:hypothetical protein
MARHFGVFVTEAGYTDPGLTDDPALTAAQDGRAWRQMALGEDLRVLLAHSMRNGLHHLPRPGGMTRLDLVRWKRG